MQFLFRRRPSLLMLQAPRQCELLHTSKVLFKRKFDSRSIATSPPPSHFGNVLKCPRKQEFGILMLPARFSNRGGILRKKQLTLTEKRFLSSNKTSKDEQRFSAVMHNTIPEPSAKQLRLVMMNVGLPFVGFGIMDNAILIVAGDAIDVSLGVTLGISTLCAAAIGNIISDVAGVMLGTVIEDMCAKLGLPVANITEAQRTLRSVRFAGQAGCAIGITIGCLIGMFPLMFIDSQLAERKKKVAMINQTFSDVVTEATELIHAENVALFLVRDTQSPDNEDTHWQSSGALPPHYKGKYFWAKYVADIDGWDRSEQHKQSGDERTPPANSNTSEGTSNNETRPPLNVVLRVPLTKGVKSRVFRTGEPFLRNNHPENDPDFDYVSSLRGKDTRHFMLVPIKDIKGNVIGLLQAVNKRPYGHEHEDNHLHRGQKMKAHNYGFTEYDMHILSALASHISVHLQNVEAMTKQSSPSAASKSSDNQHSSEPLSLTDTIRSLQRHTTVRPMDHNEGHDDEDEEEAHDGYTKRPSIRTN